MTDLSQVYKAIYVKIRLKYKFLNPEGMYFIRFAVIRWIDVLTRNINRDILIDSLRYLQEMKGLRLHTYEIMINHIHMIASVKEGFQLQNIILTRPRPDSYR